MKKLITLVLLTLTLSACSTSESTVEEETSMPTEEATEVQASATLTTDITDVNSGETLGAAALVISPSGQSFLSASATLPALEEGYFYEGWLVRSEPLSVVSTGAMEEEMPLEFYNDFTGDVDYSDHPKYIITLEPDDGDPAPAGHVADGTLSL